MTRKDVVKTLGESAKLLRATRGLLFVAHIQIMDLAQEPRQELKDRIEEIDAQIVSALDELYDLPEIERKPLRSLEEENPS